MINKPSRLHTKSWGRMTLSTLGFSTLFLFTACSSDDTTPEQSVPSEAVSAPTHSAKTPSSMGKENPTPDRPADFTKNVVNEHPATPVSAEGAQIYASQCQTCHQNGLLNAPKYGDKDAWRSRIVKGKKTLYSHSAQGFNKMPAQVNAQISEAQVHAAVDYMLAAVSQR